jgi:hypothetical protein
MVDGPLVINRQLFMVGNFTHDPYAPFDPPSEYQLADRMHPSISNVPNPEPNTFDIPAISRICADRMNCGSDIGSAGPKLLSQSPARQVKLWSSGTFNSQIFCHYPLLKNPPFIPLT